MAKHDILVARTSGVISLDGQMMRIAKGKTTIRSGHPLLNGREHLFEPLSVTFELPVEAAAKATSVKLAPPSERKPPRK
jgi:hypothetical protein